MFKKRKTKTAAEFLRMGHEETEFSQNEVYRL